MFIEVLWFSLSYLYSFSYFGNIQAYLDLYNFVNSNVYFSQLNEVNDEDLSLNEYLACFLGKFINFSCSKKFLPCCYKTFIILELNFQN